MIEFNTSDELLQIIMDTAAIRCLGNIKDFGGRKVLVEGGGYEKIWLETQPMGGRMYAGHNMEVALNNQLMFMEHRRKDGRIPGSIAFTDGRVVPQFNKFQGFCFPDEALEMYYLTGMDEDYLTLLYDTLEGFDDYLWRYRDSDGDGCLESFCRYDTGEDNAVRYADAPDPWEEDEPPKDREVVPMASMDVMSYSYSCRHTMSIIAGMRGYDRDVMTNQRKAKDVLDKMKEYLWDENRAAYYDRDRDHHIMPVLLHNNLRCMYWGSMTQDMADRFVTENLLDPARFWTKMPLPSVAANDPLYYDDPDNNWSGQVQALTYQRAIRALERYGYIHLIPVLGNKLFEAIGRDCAFVQQFEPHTGQPSWDKETNPRPSYGPAMLSAMEYCKCMYGIRIKGNKMCWGAASGRNTVYKLVYNDTEYLMENVGDSAVGRIDGREVFRVKRDNRIKTDMKGNILGVYPYSI